MAGLPTRQDLLASLLPPPLPNSLSIQQPEGRADAHHRSPQTSPRSSPISSLPWPAKPGMARSLLLLPGAVTLQSGEHEAGRLADGSFEWGCEGTPSVGTRRIWGGGGIQVSGLSESGVSATEPAAGGRLRNEDVGSAGSAETFDQRRSHWTEGHGGHGELTQDSGNGVHASVQKAALGTRSRGHWFWGRGRWLSSAQGDPKSRLLSNGIGHSGVPGASQPPPRSSPLPRAAQGKDLSWEDGAEAATWPWASLLQREAAF